MILKELSPGVIKLAPDGSVLAKVLQGVTARTNAGRMSASVVISTEDEDRSGDIVVVRGIDLRDHARNPVALLNHDKDMPIGRFADPLGNYTVKRRGDRELVGEIYFNQNSAFAHDVFRAVEEKVFSGVSIGFIPVKVEKRHTRGHVYHQGRMVEGSLLTIGDNPNAIVECVNKGFSGRPLCPELLAVLTPLCPSRKAAVPGGWETKAMPTPMDDDDTLAGGAGGNPAPTDPMAPGGDPMSTGDDPLAGGQDSGLGAPPANPLADHHSATDEGGEAMVAALWNLVKDKGIDREKGIELMRQVFEVHHAVKHPHDGGDDGDLGDLDADDDDMDFGGDDDDDSDSPLDLNDDDKDKAEKAMRVEWNKRYAGTITAVAKGLVQIASHPNPCPRKIQKGVEKMLDRLQGLPDVNEVIEKALAAGVVVKRFPPADEMTPEERAEALAVIQEFRQVKEEIFG